MARPGPLRADEGHGVYEESPGGQPGERVQPGAASEPSLPMVSLCSHELAGCQELWGHLWHRPRSLSHGLQGRGREEVGQLGRGGREVPASRTTFEAMQVPVEESSPKGPAVPDQSAAPGLRGHLSRSVYKAHPSRGSASFLSSVLFTLSPHLSFSASL